MTNWAKVTPALRAMFDRGVEGGGLVGRQAKDEGAQHMHAMFLEGLELTGKGIAGVVEVFEDGLESFGGHGFDADQRSLDVGFAHGVEILAVFTGLHGDLSEEDHVLGELGELRHEEKAFGTDGGKLFELRDVVLLAGEAEIGEGDGIEVVVGQGDEAEADATKTDDLVDDRLEGALARLLPIGAPDAAEGAVFRAAANGLDGGPHVFVASA